MSKTLVWMSFVLALLATGMIAWGAADHNVQLQQAAALPGMAAFFALVGAGVAGAEW